MIDTIIILPISQIGNCGTDEFKELAQYQLINMQKNWDLNLGSLVPQPMLDFDIVDGNGWIKNYSFRGHCSL